MSVWYGRWFSYFISLVFVTVVVIYLLDVPTIISGAPDLVKEYYYDNAIGSFILDFFLVAFYISVAMFVSDLLNIRPDDHAKQVVLLTLVSMLISTSFMFYFVGGGAKGTFFHRWFTRVGWNAVLYDGMLVSSIYIVMIAMHTQIFTE